MTPASDRPGLAPDRPPVVRSGRLFRLLFLYGAERRQALLVRSAGKVRDQGAQEIHQSVFFEVSRFNAPQSIISPGLRSPHSGEVG
jgi:hypothetical protein